MQSYDIIIRNGFIVDGTGSPGFYGDIAIRGDSIARIASKIDAPAARLIDADGKMVSPGFIDPHVHEETVALHDGLFEVFLKQGVTTTVNGNCGHSVTPGHSHAIYEYHYKNGLITEQARDKYQREQPVWQSFTEYCDVVQEKGININMGFLLGHGTIRWSVMNGSKERPPSPQEEEKILAIIEEGMQQGALGISTGLSYIPSRYAETDEIVKCAGVVKTYDGVYATHARYYIGIEESTDEAIEIGERSGVRVQVSHLKPTSPESFEKILEARERGVEICVDTIPRSTGHCTRKDRLLQFVMAISSELFDEGIEGVKAALQTPEGRAKVLEDAYIFGKDMDKVFVINTEDDEIEGKSIAAIAEDRGYEDPKELLLDLLASDCEKITFWLGGRSRKDFPWATHPEAIRNNPLVMVGSDVIFGEPWDPGSWYELQRRGSFVHFLNSYREAGVPVEEIVRRNTSMAANQFRIFDRGVLRPGMKADVAIIDLDAYSFPDPDEVDYTDPLICAEGVDYVLVNGSIALEEGEVRSAYAGEVVLNTSTAGKEEG
jgi:N-acyl-D-aspartate/D-glutamate deacylase